MKKTLFLPETAMKTSKPDSVTLLLNNVQGEIMFVNFTSQYLFKAISLVHLFCLSSSFPKFCFTLFYVIHLLIAGCQLPWIHSSA